jgi:hypothetical protein
VALWVCRASHSACALPTAHCPEPPTPPPPLPPPHLLVLSISWEMSGFLPFLPKSEPIVAEASPQFSGCWGSGRTFGRSRVEATVHSLTRQTEQLASTHAPWDITAHHHYRKSSASSPTPAPAPRVRVVCTVPAPPWSTKCRTPGDPVPAGVPGTPAPPPAPPPTPPLLYPLARSRAESSSLEDGSSSPSACTQGGFGGSGQGRT